MLNGLPINLWGREFLSQLNIITKNPNGVVTAQMLKTAFVPEKDLARTRKELLSLLFPQVKLVPKDLFIHSRAC